jgi:23S rRNA pseudouridine2605 synthase
MPQERLQKIIARAGIAARRKAEEIIAAGRVKVNDQVVTELGTKADPGRDKIEVDGRRLEMPRTPTYIVLWKPTGVVTSAADELNRRTVYDLVRTDTRVFAVGQLDYDTEGVMLLTDDGDLAAALTHSQAALEKTFRCKVKGYPTREAVEKLKLGVELEEHGLVQAVGVKVFAGDHPGQIRGAAFIELTVTASHNQLVKRLLEAVGLPPLSVRRTRFGPLDLEALGDLKPGKWRNLRKDELARLRAAATRARRNRPARPIRTKND